MPLPSISSAVTVTLEQLDFRTASCPVGLHEISYRFECIHTLSLLLLLLLLLYYYDFSYYAKCVRYHYPLVDTFPPFHEFTFSPPPHWLSLFKRDMLKCNWQKMQSVSSVLLFMVPLLKRSLRHFWVAVTRQSVFLWPFIHPVHVSATNLYTNLLYATLTVYFGVYKHRRIFLFFGNWKRMLEIAQMSPDFLIGCSSLLMCSSQIRLRTHNTTMTRHPWLQWTGRNRITKFLLLGHRHSHQHNQLQCHHQ